MHGLGSTSTRHWIGWASAALAVTAFHAGVLGYVLYQPPEEIVVEEPEGAVMMELAPLPVAPSTDAPDTPPGPAVETAEMTKPEVVEAKQPEEIPDVEPSPLAPEPEVALPDAKPVEQQEEKPQEVETREPPEEKPEPPKEAAPPVATAPPPSALAPPSPAAAARTEGTTATAARQEQSWQKSLLTHLGKHRRYPQAARAQRSQGEVQVKFKVDRAGAVVASSIIKTSGVPSLDAEALEVLVRAAPLPAPPDVLHGDTFELVIPIRFRIR